MDHSNAATKNQWFVFWFFVCLLFPRAVTLKSEIKIIICSLYLQWRSRHDTRWNKETKLSQAFNLFFCCCCECRKCKRTGPQKRGQRKIERVRERGERQSSNRRLQNFCIVWRNEQNSITTYNVYDKMSLFSCVAKMNNNDDREFISRDTCSLLILWVAKPRSEFTLQNVAPAVFEAIHIHIARALETVCWGALPSIAQPYTCRTSHSICKIAN